MIGCLRTRVRKQPTIALYFESENGLKFYNLEARAPNTLTSMLNDAALSINEIIFLCFVLLKEL